MSAPPCLDSLVHDDGPVLADRDTVGASWRRMAWRGLGSVSVGIGIVNAFLPLLPTTVFLLIGLWAWSKGAPEWHARLLDHPRYGPTLRHWRDGRRITRRGKQAAAGGMALSYGVTLAVAGIGPVTLAVGVGLTALGTWLWMRPEPQSKGA